MLSDWDSTRKSETIGDPENMSKEPLVLLKTICHTTFFHQPWVVYKNNIVIFYMLIDLVSYKVISLDWKKNRDYRSWSNLLKCLSALVLKMYHQSARSVSLLCSSCKEYTLYRILYFPDDKARVILWS